MNITEKIRFSPQEYQERLAGIVAGLRPLRTNKDETDSYLEALFPCWRAGKRCAVTEYNRELDLMRELIKVLSAEKQSFGYAYYWVGRALNVEAGFVLYNDIVNYAEQNHIEEQIIQEEAINRANMARQPDTRDERPTAQQIPNTEREKKAFAKAVEVGYMEKTATGYKWIYNSGSKASLSYFIMQVFSPDNTKQIPFKALGKLFDVTRLDRALDQATTAKKPQQWRGAIDNLLKDL